RVIEERQGGFVMAEYVYGGWIDEVLTMDRGGNTYYYHTNALCSIVALSDSAGDIVEHYRYDAYGKPEIFVGAGVDGIWFTGDDVAAAYSVVGNPYLFTGRRLDEETGFYYYRARYYGPERGRFLQRDPLGYVDGMNLYEYADNNTVNLTDPLGLYPTKESGAAQLAAASTVLKGLCEDPCCKCKEDGTWEPCKPEDCKADAQKIVNALVDTWNRNYGKGSCGPPHAVGGYLCWDWAGAFDIAANSVPSPCWKVKEAMVDDTTPGSTTVHFFIKLHACNDSSDSCTRMIDDGFLGPMLHSPPWPPAPWAPGIWTPPSWQWCTPHIRN
ncbi:RHS repeat-associated core domain-containing protein, partial [bacterium]|nr:RHS repeat-associated core domain-containing protein [bacterium]